MRIEMAISCCRILVLIVFASLLCVTMASPTYLKLPPFASKPHVAVLTDICNEPDDAESLTRFLLYSNEFHVDALIATTSTWQRTTTRSDQILQIIDAYATVHENLNSHVPESRQYPSADSLRAVVRDGLAGYGLAAARGPLSEGTKFLIEVVDAIPSTSHIWVLLWGGANVLAQALLSIQASRSADEVNAFCAKLRVYAISDQDDTGAWIRVHFPNIFYIASVHAWNAYGLAAWTGIAGEAYYSFDGEGPDSSLVTKEWLRENVQIGKYGKVAYPDPVFIMEGDTPTFLSLIQNGLTDPEKPEWGGWGGRYGLLDVDESGSKHYADAADSVVGKDGKTYLSSQATIWRWREAYQGDFAARIQWTLSNSFDDANHAPVVVVNDNNSIDVLNIKVTPGATVRLDASASWSPDEAGHLSFKWFHYREPSATQWTTKFEVPELKFVGVSNVEGRTHEIVEVKIPGTEEGCPHPFTPEVTMKYGDKTYHLILEVVGGGKHPMRSYKRILVEVTTSLQAKEEKIEHNEL